MPSYFDFFGNVSFYGYKDKGGGCAKGKFAQISIEEGRDREGE